MAVALVAAFAVVYSYVTVTAMSVLGRRRKESSLQPTVSSVLYYSVRCWGCRRSRHTDRIFSEVLSASEKRLSCEGRCLEGKCNSFSLLFFFLFLVGNFEHGWSCIIKLGRIIWLKILVTRHFNMICFHHLETPGFLIEDVQSDHFTNIKQCLN